MKKEGVIYIVLAATCWGSIGVFFHYLGAFGFSGSQVVAMRVTVAAIALGLWMLFRRRELFKVNWKHLWLFVGTGILSLFCFNLCYFYSMQLTTISIAAVLLYTAPVFVMLLSALLFKERFTMRKAAALLSTLLGCVLVTGLGGTQTQLPTLGILLGVISGVCYALYSIFGSYALIRYDSVTITFYTFLFASAASLAFSKPIELIPRLWDWRVASLALGVGLVGCLAPYLLYTKGLSKIEAGKASVVASLEPVVGTLFSVFMFGEPMTWSKVAGIMLILSAVAILNLGSGKKPSVPQDAPGTDDPKEPVNSLG